MRCQLKMLCGDLFTFSIRANQSGGSPHCRLCLAPVEDLPHVVSSCPELEEPRQSVTNGLEQLLVRSSTQDTVSISGEQFERLVADDELFTQFVVDPTSFNLPDPYRINVNDANLIQICKLTRNLCFSINQLRIRKLRDINNY